MEKPVSTTTRKLPWMKSAIPKKRASDEATSKPKAPPTRPPPRATSKNTKKRRKGSSDDDDDDGEEKLQQRQDAGEDREEVEEEEEEATTKKPTTHQQTTTAAAAGAPAAGGRLLTTLSGRKRHTAKASRAEGTEAEETTSAVAPLPAALDEVPTQLDMLVATSTQLDELPTQADSPLRPVARRTKMSSRSPSLSPNPYHLLLEEATQSDSPPMRHLPLPLSASSSPLVTPPCSPTTPSPLSYLRHLDSPAQHEGGAPRSPWALSPMASPSSPSAGTASKHKRKLGIHTSTKDKDSFSSSSTTTSSGRSTWRRLMSQATQADLISSPPSPSIPPQDDSSSAYDDLDAMLGRSTQSDDGCHGSNDLLYRSTQTDDGASEHLGGVSPIRPKPSRRGRNKRASPHASPRHDPARSGHLAASLVPKGRRGGNDDVVEDTSLDTSLLLLDTSTQDDDVDLGEHIQENGDDDAEDDDEAYLGSARSSASPKEEMGGEKGSKSSRPLGLSSLGATQEDHPSPSNRLPPTEAEHALDTSTQMDLSFFALADAEGESLGSIPTLTDTPAFNLVDGLLPTQVDDNSAQIDNLPTQLDSSLSSPFPLGLDQMDTKWKEEDATNQNPRRATKPALQETPTLVDALDYEPTPPLDLDEESPGFSAALTKSSKKRKVEDGTKDERTAGAKRRSREEQRSKTAESCGSDHSSRWRPGAGDRQEEAEEAKFGKLISLNPKFKSVVIPEDGTVSVVKRRALSASQGEESNDTPSLGLPDEDAPPCKYGASCYRKNPQHFRQFKHPALSHFDVTVEDMSTNGTYINESLIGKGNKQALHDGEELSLVLCASNRPTDAPFELIAYRYENRPPPPST